MRSVLAGQLTGADIGSRILVRIDVGHRSAPRVCGGVLSDVEAHRVGTRLAHVAVHPDGRLCTGATTARSPRVAVYAGGYELFLRPDQPLFVSG